MISKEQANIVADELLEQQPKAQLPFLKPGKTVSRKRTQIGLAIGMFVGTMISMYISGSAMPGMGLGMCAGVLTGAYLDAGISNKFIAWFTGAGIALAILLWVLKVAS